MHESRTLEYKIECKTEYKIDAELLSVKILGQLRRLREVSREAFEHATCI